MTDRVTVTTGATVLVAANAFRTACTVTNRDASNSVYLGEDSTLTTANGYQLGPGESFTIDTNADVYVISAAGGEVIHVFDERA